MRVATSRINYRGKESEIVLDTTYKTGSGDGKNLASTKKMVWDSKNGNISWNEYIERYKKLIEVISIEMYPEVFAHLLNSEKTIVFTCYCADTHDTTKHCHRYLLVDIFKELAEQAKLPFEYIGELKNENTKRKNKQE